MKKKTTKTPLVTAEAFGPASCPSRLVPESKLSHRPEVQYGLVPRLSRHKWKNLENHSGRCNTFVIGQRSRFSWFFFLSG